MCATGHYSPARGCYSVDRMEAGEPSDSLLAHAMAQRDRAKVVSVSGGSCKCTTQRGGRQARTCDECVAIRAGNRALVQLVAMRARRLGIVGAKREMEDE